LRLPFRHIGAGRDEKFLRLFEIACVLVRLDHVARFIVNANHSVMWAAIMHRVADGVASRARSTITKPGRTAAHRKSDRRRDDLCGAGLGKRVLKCTGGVGAVGNGDLVRYRSDASVDSNHAANADTSANQYAQSATNGNS
jgi:hypothetical protein